MICLLEERVCNLVLLWCITVIAHHCKLVKLQSSISDYRPSDLWSYDDIEVSRPQNESNIRLVKNHHGDSYYLKSDDRKLTRQNDQERDDMSLRNRDHFGSRTSIEIPIGTKLNDGEISISKKITFNGNNSRSNNHPLWFNALEKNAMSLPASISFNLKNLYAERKPESTKRPYDAPGVIFATKNIPLNMSASNRNKIKYQPNYEPEYDEPALPPSLPNLEIIPFVASDALDKPKDNVADRKEGIEYGVEDETTPMDQASMIKKFSPPVLTEGGFVPRDPTLDELYFESKFNFTYSTPRVVVTEMTSEYRVTESIPKQPADIVPENIPHRHIEYSTTSTSTTTTTTTTSTTEKPSTTTVTTSTTTQATPSTFEPTSTTPHPPPPTIHYLTTKPNNYSTIASLLKYNSTSTTTSTTTTEDPSLEESEDEESDDEDEEVPIPEPETPIKESPTNNTKEETPEPEDNYLLSNILTMIFDDYTAPSKEKTTTVPPKKTTQAFKSTSPPTRPTTTTIPPFKHVYIPTTESTSTVKNIDKNELVSTKLSINDHSIVNETQQNQIKYIANLPQSYNQPSPKPTSKPIKEKPYSHNEIYHSVKSDSVISGLLKLSGCNIFGKMYKTGEQIEELSEPCSKCICSEAGVHCIQVKC